VLIGGNIMDFTGFNHMFTLMIPVLEKILRPIIVYFFLVVGLRLAGKRELAQLNPFDLVVLLTLSNTVQNAIIGEDNSVLGGLIGATTLLIVNYLLVHLVHSSHKLEQLIEGDADILIEGGAINYTHLKHEDISIDELKAAAQKNGIDSLDNVLNAVLEPDGVITFALKPIVPLENRQVILLERMEQIQQQLSDIKLALEKR
jgi:uncharacterized membrane protein YcaP (DUF421 family)